MKKITLITTLCLLASLFLKMTAFSQVRIDWQQCYGTTDDDYCEGVQPYGNGYWVAGSVTMWDGMCQCASFYYSGTWLFQLDGNLSISQQGCYVYVQGHIIDLAVRLLANDDGDSFMVGIIYSDINVADPDRHLFVDKLDESLNPEWFVELNTEHTLVHAAPCAVATDDKGVAAAAVINEGGGDAAVYFGGNDCWVVKIGANGQLQWERTLGTEGDEAPGCLISTRDGGILAGLRASLAGTGNIGCGQTGNHDVLVKLDADGNILWNICLSEAGLTDVLELDDGYLIAGTSDNANSASDCALTRCDLDGNVLWSQHYGGSGKETMVKMFRDGPDGFTVFANATSTDGDLASAALLGNPVNERGNIWVFHVDDLGNLLWERCLGSTKGLLEEVVDVVRTDEGQFLLAGNMTWFEETTSGDVHCTNNAVIPYSSQNLWVLHVTDVFDYTATAERFYDQVSLYPNPAQNEVKVTGEGIREVEVRNLLGQQVAQTECPEGVDSIIVSLEGLPQGVYIVSVRLADGKRCEKKLVVQQ